MWVDVTAVKDKADGYGRVVLRREPVIIGDIWDDTPWLRDMREQAGAEMRALFGDIHSWMGVPLIAKDNLIGVLRVDHVEPHEPSMSIRVREALHNIVKHARASRVDLDLTCGESAILLRVKDNGLGFDTSKPFPGHLGLRSMRERAECVGGTFELESTPGRGTLIQVLIQVCGLDSRRSAR